MHWKWWNSASSCSFQNLRANHRRVLDLLRAFQHILWGYETTRGFVLFSLFWVSSCVRDNKVCLSGWVWVLLHYFPSYFSISSTCQVGHLDLEILLSHISSNLCDVFCWTLHPPRAVVCRPRQTREGVHILVATIQWSSDTVATWYSRNLNGSRCPKTCYCPKTWVLASLRSFLGFHTNNGFLHWKTISNFRHLALYSKQFQFFIISHQNFKIPSTLLHLHKSTHHNRSGTDQGPTW